METHTPNPAERFTIIREQMRLRLVARGAGPLVVLLWDLFLRLLTEFAIHAQRARQQQACRDHAGAEPGRIGAPAADAGADRQGTAGPPDAGARPAAAAAVAAAADTSVIDRATDEDCIRDEPGARTACARTPRDPQHSAAIARAVAVLEHGSPVFEARFAKMDSTTQVELSPFSYDLATLSDCCRA